MVAEKRNVDNSFDLFHSVARKEGTTMLEMTLKVVAFTLVVGGLVSWCARRAQVWWEKRSESVSDYRATVFLPGGGQVVHEARFSGYFRGLWASALLEQHPIGAELVLHRRWRFFGWHTDKKYIKLPDQPCADVPQTP